MALVLTASALATYFTASWTLGNLMDVIKSLRTLGLSRVKLTSILLVKSAIISIISGATGYLISYAILSTLLNYLQPHILLHSVKLVHDLQVLTASTVLPLITTSTSMIIKCREL